MRVVSGKNKGIALKAVPGNTTRPTTDKVKEAIFNMIGPYFDGGQGLDLFAGSGGLGIEALSRGLDHLIFVDKEGKAIQTIKANLAQCKLEAQAEVYRNDADRALKALVKREKQFDVIFLDPPYKKQQLERIVGKMEEEKMLTTDGIIVCEHGSEIILPEKIGSLQQMKYEKYGIIGVTIYSYLTEQ